ncbi:unnamed protein product [Acanthoscelides obtectus]|uniref:Uncharacterized protein n=1 Tax=Acanthoscelides obtectus TaxID=200917 RepID=A0A9P0LJ59_ACAOB|nr:unnamed protein product [Acanthoscelides obtectus]CAK1663315.1 hypothetical protein AOBTE_LOCUS23608 [Acanthoscelides obtectus]
MVSWTLARKAQAQVDQVEWKQRNQRMPKIERSRKLGTLHLGFSNGSRVVSCGSGPPEYFSLKKFRTCFSVCRRPSPGSLIFNRR